MKSDVTCVPGFSDGRHYISASFHYIMSINCLTELLLLLNDIFVMAANNFIQTAPLQDSESVLGIKLPWEEACLPDNRNEIKR